MSAPKWATDLVAQVVDDEGLSFVPELRWRRSRRWPYHYRGHAYQCRDSRSIPTGRCKGFSSSGVLVAAILVTVGVRVPRWKQKMVVLHEMAHFIGGFKHNARFWGAAWDLYRKHNLPLRLVLANESNYRKGAVAGYRRNVAKQKEADEE